MKNAGWIPWCPALAVAVLGAVTVKADTITIGGSFPGAAEVIAATADQAGFGDDAMVSLAQSFSVDSTFSAESIYLEYENDSGANIDWDMTVKIFEVADVEADPFVAGATVYTGTFTFPAAAPDPDTEMIAKLDLTTPVLLNASVGTAGYALQITATSGGSFLPGFEWTRTTGGNAYTGGAGYEDGAHREDRDFALALTAPESEPEPGTLTVSDSKDLSNPDILAYNLGHFMAGTATHDWWRYSGVNGARIFISPATLESDSYVLSESNGDGVTDLAGFLARKEALRADPLNEDYINWTYFNDRFENKVFAGNRFTVNYALGKLRELDIDVLVQATAKENHFPITDADDWGGKWELWQHFYIQAFYLGRYFDVHRFQMFNEPNHSNADGLTPENWLMRLQLASDAIQSATADVNTMYGKSLEPLVYGPVNSSGADYYSGTGWGDYMVENRHVNFLGETNENYLVVHRYDYHEYNSGPGTFASNLSSLRSALNADMSPETRFPISLSEFNVHTAGDFDEMVDTLDYPAKYTRFGAIAASLADDFLKEFYCFKFGQVTKDGTYPVGKNGMHYVQNDGAYEYGGATKAAEVWRLFIKALKPGGEQKKFDLDGDSSPDDLYIRATYVPDAGNYYIFIANEGGGTNLRVDTSAWGLPEGTPFLLEEVSESRYGIGRTWNQVSADGTLWDGEDNEFYMAGDQVWLFTIAAKDTEDELIIDATEDASVVDGINAGTQYGSESTLLVRNDPTTANERKATFIKFDLPVYYPPDIQRAVLTFTGKSESNVLTQAHVYGLDDDSWSEDSLTWNNAPNLLKGVAAGNLIENRVVSGQGDSAFIQGQLVFPNDSNKEQIIDVTDFLRSQSNREVSFMITQDPRWDVALPSLAVGDTQPGGLEIKSIESGSAPRLKIVLLQDTDGDGISNEAESNDFNTDPEVADTDGDGQGDGEEIFAGSDPNDSSSVFAIPTALPFDGGFKVEWNSRTDRTYLLDRAFSLSSSNWAEIYSADGTGSTMTYLDSIGNTNAFYRLNVQ